MFKHEIQKFIEDKALFTLKDKVLVALSGGADSVALLRVLLSLGYACECMHCNFHLRGEESDRDEAFVRALCEACSVPLHIIHFDTEKYAKEHHQSIEMAARELRYGWFHRLREERHASVIAVAHHRDDSVETFLLNLMRGTGIDGLKGIPVRNGFVVRPLLQESRENILEYLKAIHQDYVTDSTNLQDEYVRNKIRLNILPLMKEINPSVMASIHDTAFRLSEVATVYHQDRDNKIKQIVKKSSEDFMQVSIADILNDIAPDSILYELLSPLGFKSDQMKDIRRCMVHSQSGKRFLSKEWELVRDREDLLIYRIHHQEAIPELLVEEMEYTSDFVIPRNKYIACLDADKVETPLTIRKWLKGDKFVPFGMTGKKKVSDY
jgi:tRNA(Ile)-lysidine synthase